MSTEGEIMNYLQFYDLVMEEIHRLTEAAFSGEEYRLVKALAACYELQEYLANRLAALGLEEEF